MLSDKQEEKEEDTPNTHILHVERKQEIQQSEGPSSLRMFGTNRIHLQHMWAASVPSVSTSNELKSSLLLLSLILLIGGYQPTFRQKLHKDTHLCQHPITWSGSPVWCRNSYLALTSCYRKLIKSFIFYNLLGVFIEMSVFKSL